MPRRRPDPTEEDLPSRGKVRRLQRDRDAELANLAQKLVSMGESARKRLPLDDALRDEIAVAVTIPHGTGQRRQMRRITQLLRESGAGAIERALNPPPASKHAPPTTPAEQWVERLVGEGDDALQALMDTHPDADRVRLRQWVRTVVAAREAAAKVVADGGPQPPRSRPERTLRKYLAELLG